MDIKSRKRKMKYQVELTKEAKEDLDNLNSHDADKLVMQFNTIQKFGTEAVYIKSIIQSFNKTIKLFEIRRDNLRAIFTYREGRILLKSVLFLLKRHKRHRKCL